MAEEKVKENLEGEGEKHEPQEVVEKKLNERDLPEEEEEDDNDEEEEEEEEEEEKEEVKPVKKRRCQKRKKVRQILYDEEDDEGEEIENEVEGEDEEGELFYDSEEEGIESVESDHVSFTSSVLSSISFVWEHEVYEFEELCDPGNIEPVYRPTSLSTQEELLDEFGIESYLEMCRNLNIYPMARIIHSLKQEEIDLSHCNVDSKNIRAMCTALEVNSIVKSLKMRYNKLTVDDCNWLGLMLRSNKTISEMDFTGCRMGPEGLKLLVTYLPENEYLEDLNLSKCNLQDEGMKILAYVLMSNNSIQNLDLSYNNLGEESGDALGSAFRLNSSVTNLILRYNNLFYPPPMNGFFRALSANKSISYLDLSWNGLSGVDIGSYIGNFLRRSTSIRYLDLSDNRLEGAAVLEIKKGMSKSRNLEILKLGKNPMSPADLSVMLAGVKGNELLKVLDFQDLWVEKPFLKTLKKIQQSREIEVNYAGVFSNYEVFGPDYPQVILRRAQFEAQKPKSIKKKKDFGHLMWTLGEEPLTTDEFMTKVKKFKAKINKQLFPELIKQFTIPKVQLIDVVAMKEKYLSIFPDSTPPPPPQPKKGKKQKDVEEVAPKEPVVDVKPEHKPEDVTEFEDEEGELIIEEIEGEMEMFEGLEEDEEELVMNENDENEGDWEEEEEEEKGEEELETE